VRSFDAPGWGATLPCVQGIESQFALIAGLVAGVLVGVAWTWRHERGGRAQGQAALVAGRILATGPQVTGAWLTNGSELPVYSVVAWVVATGEVAPGTGEEWVGRIRPGAQRPDGAIVAREPSTPALLPLLPPGVTELELPAWASSGAARRPAVELAFTDASGRHWIRRAGGRLERLNAPAWRHYGFTSPDMV